MLAGGPVTLLNSTLTENSSAIGSGFNSGAASTIQNTIVADNIGDRHGRICKSWDNIHRKRPGDDYLIGSVLVESTGTANWDLTTDLLDEAANLGGLASNGGPTQTHLPLSRQPGDRRRRHGRTDDRPTR